MISWPQSNPFSTRYVQPGSLKYLFPAGEDAGQLIERLRQSGWWGQVTGPHGAGKTTLLHTLRPLLQQAARELEWYTLHAGQRRLPQTFVVSGNSRNARSLVIVDGYEQLGWPARRRLKRRCRRVGAGLLVTSHADSGFPPIFDVRPSLPILQRLATQLLEQYPRVLHKDDIADRFQACSGNVREVLFTLYDLYELRRNDV